MSSWRIPTIVHRDQQVSKPRMARVPGAQTISVAHVMVAIYNINANRLYELFNYFISIKPYFYYYGIFVICYKLMLLFTPSSSCWLFSCHSPSYHSLCRLTWFEFCFCVLQKISSVFCAAQKSLFLDC